MITPSLPRQIETVRNFARRVCPILIAALLQGFVVPVARAQGAPQLVSVTPANGSTNADINTSIVFVFDQTMDTNVPVLASFPPFVVGNFDVTPANHYISGSSWSADGRTLTCPAQVPLPANSTVSWTLNPNGSMFPLTSSGGVPLATVSGSFKTGSGGGGGCSQTGFPPGWGNYSITKNYTYDQTSAADPVPAAQSPFLFGAFVQSPSGGPAVTAGSVTLPDSTSLDLDGFGSTFFYATNPPTENALDTAFPAGAYTLRFTQTGQSERVINMTMAGNPPVPKIANFAAAQAVNASQDFTLNWNAFTGAGASDYISLSISDASHVVFQAPDPCVPRTLAVSATSINIPAGTLTSNKVYTAVLSFGRNFYFSTNAVPQMAGSGSIVRMTQFTINTGSVSLPDPANLTGSRLLQNGNPAFDLTGTPTRSYNIERTGTLNPPGWSQIGTVSLDSLGKGVYEDTTPNKTFPLFYRAVGN